MCWGGTVATKLSRASVANNSSWALPIVLLRNVSQYLRLGAGEPVLPEVKATAHS